MQELKNKLTQQAAASASERVPEQMQQELESSVGAGLDILFSEETSDLVIEHMQGEGDKFSLLGQGCAAVAMMVWASSEGKIPLRIIIPAGVIITLHALELLEDSIGIEITNEGMGDAITEFSSTFLQSIGATPEKLEEMMANGEAPEGVDPDQAMAAMQELQGGGGQEPPMEPALEPQGPPAGIVGNNMGV